MIARINVGEHELVIKKSRFLAYSFEAENRDDVDRAVSALRAEHKDARHVCYGFIVDEKGDDFGFDDDGEPSGTAGKPIYSAIVASGARKSLIAVVRYFGGIKLGAGGLTRAYRQSAAELIEKVGISVADKVVVYELVCDGEAYKKATAVLRNIGAETEKIEYGKNVVCTVTAPPSFDAARSLSPFGVKVTRMGEKYVARTV